ncbi:hypothetical protein GCM10029976_046470 [Kribbella albertanoniae]
MLGRSDERNMSGLQDSQISDDKLTLSSEWNVHQPSPGLYGGKSGDACGDAFSEVSITQRTESVDESGVVGIGCLGRQHRSRSPPDLRRKHMVRLT